MALQMTWNPSLLHQKRKNGPPLGLKNIGNSCYLNSVLQCLTYTPPLANFCLKNQHSSLCDSSSEATERKRDCPFCILEKRIVRSLSVDLTLDAPSKIQSCLRIFSEHFRLGRQEDAHEFLRYVIDACHNSCLRLKKQRRKGTEPNVTAGGDSVVKEIFGGALQSQVKCLSCGAESNKVDEIMDLSLDLFQSNSLKEALQRFFRPEVLDGSNKYKCEKCKKLVAAKKQMSIQQAPNILVIQLKRFEGVLGGKIDRAITFEEVLVLSSYMCKESQDPHPEYKLFGTIVHSGYSSDSGHYYAYIKDAMGQWYCCNDSYVSVSTLQEVLSERVYILFFSRTSQRPKISKTAFVSNGVKTPEQNGNDSSVSQKADFSMKTGSASLHGEHSSRKDTSTMSKTGTVPSSSRMKFGNLRNPDSKRVLTNGNGNLDVHKTTLMENQRDLKVPLHVEKVKKEMPSIINRNGGKENKCAIAANCKNKPTFGESCENGEENVGTSSVKAEVCEGDGTRENERVTAGRGPSIDRLLLNGEGKCQSDTPGLKRKSNGKESCILFAQDDFSLLKLEEFKESLRKDASSMLRSCGWSDRVYNFMCTRKRLCAREAGNSPTTNIDPRKLLVAEAKSTFISQIPESLKEKLVKQLRSFSK